MLAFFRNFAAENLKKTNMIKTLDITDMYMKVLTSLDNNQKLDLIAKLSASMREDASTKRTRPNLRTCFSGNWDGLEANRLRNHAYHGRTLGNW